MPKAAGPGFPRLDGRGPRHRRHAGAVARAGERHARPRGLPPATALTGPAFHRQPLAGEKIFDQQRLRHVVGRGEPDFADPLARRRAVARRNVRSPPRLFDDMMREAMAGHARASSNAVAARAMAPRGPA